ncbi:PucR family transcriptional regulator, partial [Streptomyces nigra]
MAGGEDGAGQAGVSDAAPSAWAQELLDHLRPHGRDVRRVVSWLADAVRGTACLQDDTGTVVAGTRPPLVDQLVDAVAAGRIASAAWEGQGRHLRLVRVAYPDPSAAGVLAVSRPEPFDRRAADIVGHTAHVL